MNKIYLLILAIILIPSCAPNRINTKKERKHINYFSEERINKSISRYNTSDGPEYQNKKLNFHDQTLSLDKAISVALEHNNSLQADLESLGIAKADLIQAGLLSNPYFETEYKIPRPQCKNEHAKVELHLSFTLSDLWQIPRRKKVAQDELEITSIRIVNSIIDIFSRTKIAYYSSIYASDQEHLAERILHESKKLEDRYSYRQQLGYSSELDTNLAHVMVQHWLIEVNQSKNTVYASFRDLENILGIEISNQPIILENIIDIQSFEMPTLKELEQYAIENRPELQMTRLRIQKAADLIKYEQSQFIPSVELGLAYEREIDKKKLAGPMLNISLPIFDTNYAQVARARAQKKQFEQEYRTVLRTTLTEVKQLYNKFNVMKDSIKKYNAMIPSFNDALSYVKKHMKNMQFTMLTFYQTQIAYYQEQQNALNAQLELLTTLAQLEKAIGKQLFSIPKYDNKTES